MKLKWAILIIALLLLFVYCWMINLRNSKTDHLIKISKSVNVSKNEEAFVGSYRIVKLDNRLIDTINKESLQHINFDSVDIWIEKEYHYYHAYLFFKKHVYSDELRLVIEDPTSLMRNGANFPFIGFKIKDSDYYTGKRGMGGAVCVIEVGKELPNNLLLEVYLNYDNNLEDTYVGDVEIELQKYPQSSSFE